VADDVLVAREVSKRLGSTLALDSVSLRLIEGEAVAVVGPSGCGKSTLLQVLSGMLTADGGAVTFRGRALEQLSDGERSAVRLRHFGFAFQFGELVPELTLRENVELPLRLTGVRARPARQRSAALLESLGIADLADRRSSQVSGGQSQRAAIARAMVHEPAILFADEPTGALDSRSGTGVLDAMLDLARVRSTAVLLVTHDPAVAARCDRVVEMHDGRVSAGVPA
jgi:putative ABC transport system ATP-binding protein